jgi:hypothetical protein
MQAHTLLPAYPHAHLKTFQTIQPVDTFEIDMPALTPKQDVNALVTKPWTAHGNVANAHAHSRLIPGVLLRYQPPREKLPSRHARSTLTLHISMIH